MKGLISRKYSHMLWKDELGAVFLLLKYAEVYKYSENTLRLLIFSRQKLCQVKENCTILNEIDLDEQFAVVDVDIRNLNTLITLGSYKRRPNIKGKWIKDKEQRLGHKIIPFNPKLN